MKHTHRRRWIIPPAVAALALSAACGGGDGYASTDEIANAGDLEAKMAELCEDGEVETSDTEEPGALEYVCTKVPLQFGYLQAVWLPSGLPEEADDVWKTCSDITKAEDLFLLGEVNDSEALWGLYMSLDEGSSGAEAVQLAQDLGGSERSLRCEDAS